VVKIEPGDVIRIGGDHVMWHGCLMLVEEVMSWGVVGSVFGPAIDDEPCEYPLRIGNESIDEVYRKVEEPKT
jgi:hypothetical protein